MKSTIQSRIILIVCTTLLTHISICQTASLTREERFKKLESKMIFPLIKGGYMCGVIPVDNITSKPGTHIDIKLIFDFTQTTSKDNQAKKINEGLEEVARILNLHIASGVKKTKLKSVIIFHSGSIISILNNEFYQQNYKSNNPNVDMLKQLSSAGVEMVICGQSLALRNVPHSMLLPDVKIALAAKTTLSKYQSQGYIAFEIKTE